jgi:HSP20 family protein
MNLTRWDPFRELDALSSRMNQLFPATVRRNDDVTFADWAPAVDVQETDKEYLVKADLPEIKKEDMKIAIDDGVLSMEGERKQEKEEKNKKFHKVERVYGKFVRRMALPSDVDETKVSAEFKDGVLNVHLPKAPTARPHSVDVKIM